MLDTWFSSGLWPFSTMGWPDDTETLRKFYPTSVLVTGFDIIFFWVARMIMFGLEAKHEVPFRDVYIHALVRDEKGQKMSKSRGNVIDPLTIVKDYGADALRLTLAALTVQGRDIFLSTERISTYRLFMNKLWNASRFALMNLEDAEAGQKIDENELQLQDKWILNRISQVSTEMTRLLDGYFFGEAARLMYDFTWSELCDWYIELAKPVQETIRAVRNLRAEARIAPQQTIPGVTLAVHDAAKLALLKECEKQLKLLTKVEVVTFAGEGDGKPEKSLASVLDGAQIYLPVGELLDVEKEMQRLRNDLAKLEKDIEKSKAKLANEKFVERAPAEVIEKEKNTLADNEAKAARMKANLASLSE